MVLRYVKIGSLVQDTLENVISIYREGGTGALAKEGANYQVPSGKKFVGTLLIFNNTGACSSRAEYGYADDLNGTNFKKSGEVWFYGYNSYAWTPQLIPIWLEVPETKYPYVSLSNASVTIIGIEIPA